MKDMLDPILSTFSGVRWSAPDDATIEGEFALAPLCLRYVKAQRRLHLCLKEISALETWNSTLTSPEHRLAGRGELAEVLTMFELDGGQVRQFREVSEVTITPAPVAFCTDKTRHSQVDLDHLENTGSPGAFFIDLEVLRVHGKHPEPTLKLNVTMELGEFNRVYSLLHERTDDVKEVTLVLEADLFGDEIDPDGTWNERPSEYGILRPADAPLVFAPARLERMEALLERPLVLGSEPAASIEPIPDYLRRRRDPPIDGSSIIARRLAWIIALIIVIIVLLLSGEGVTDGATRLLRQFAESPASAVMHIGVKRSEDVSTKGVDRNLQDRRVPYAHPRRQTPRPPIQECDPIGSSQRRAKRTV